MGGAGANASAALAALGCYPVLAARLPCDPAAQLLLDRLEAAGVDIGNVERVAGQTRCSDILLGADVERTLISAGGGQWSLLACLAAGVLAWHLSTFPVWPT